ncbi:MAG TPA: hypothetical protein VLH79_11525 [Chthonomonadales bacterium]|nr:hypothetical protein [Chthonomonadales bacterium]
MKAPLDAATEEVGRRALSSLIRASDGLWVTCHQLWKDSKPLSRPSWGTVVDLRVRSNLRGGGVRPENAALNEVLNAHGLARCGD